MSEHSKIIRLTLLNFLCGRWRGNFTITSFLLLVGAISVYLLCIPIRQLGGQSRQSPSPRTTLTPRQSTGSRGNLSQQDRMFDRLATLVVELKQQVNKLEERVAKLESR